MPGTINTPNAIVLCLLREHAQRPLPQHLILQRVVLPLGADNILGRRTVLHPRHHGQQNVVAGVAEAGHRVDRGVEGGSLVAAGEVPGRIHCCGGARAVSVAETSGQQTAPISGGKKKTKKGVGLGEGCPEMENSLHAGDVEEAVKVVEVDALWCHCSQHVAVEVGTAVGWDERVGHAVVHEQLSPSVHKGAQVEHICGRVTRIEAICQLHDAVVEVLVVPVGAFVEEVLHVLVAERVGQVCRAAEEDGPLAFASEVEVGEDECLVHVHVVVVDFVQRVDLHVCEAAGRGLVGDVCCAQQSLGLKVALVGCRDDAVDDAVCPVALADHFFADGGEQGRWDVVGGVVGEVVGSYFVGPGLEMRGPPCRCTGDHAVEVVGVELYVSDSLTTTGGTARVVVVGWGLAVVCFRQLLG